MCCTCCPVNFDRLILLSTGFLLLFTAYMNAQNLASKILEDNKFGNLGFYTIAIIYFFFGSFSFIAAGIVRKLGDKWAMTVGGLCYVLYCAAFILPLKRTEYPENETL